MKKTLLALAIISSLTACSDDDNDHHVSTATGTVTLMDAGFVAGATIKATQDQKTSTLTTNDKGEFALETGAYSIEVSIAGVVLGQTDFTVAEGNNTLATSFLTLPQTRTTSIAHSDKVTSLLQSIDADQNAENGINLAQTVTIPATIFDATTAEAFESALAEVEIKNEQGDTIKLESNIVTLDKAVENLANSLQQALQSQAVTSVMTDAMAITDFTTVDFQAKLTQYRAELSAKDDNNSSHQQALLAMIEIAEIVNMNEVQARLLLDETTQSSGDEMLAVALDMALDPMSAVTVELNAKAQNSTQDINALLISFADRLQAAEAKLAAINVPANLGLVYQDEEKNELFAFTAQDVLMARTGALAIAAKLNFAAAYDKGSDALYLPQQETVDLAILTETTTETPIGEPNSHGWYDDYEITTDVTTSIEKFDAEFAQISINDVAVFQDQNRTLGNFTSDAQNKLTTAKTLLISAIQLAETIEHEALDQAIRQQLAAALDNLQGKENAEFVTITTESEDYGYNNYEDYDWGIITTTDTYKINLAAFFNTETGVDASDFNPASLSSYSCEIIYHSYDGEIYDETPEGAAFSLAVSKAYNTPMCIHTDLESYYYEHLDYTYEYNEETGVSITTRTRLNAYPAESTVDKTALLVASANVDSILQCHSTEEFTPYTTEGEEKEFVSCVTGLPIAK